MALGLRRYFTGRPCAHGHIADRYISGLCIPCAKAKTAAWREQYPERKKSNSLREYERGKDRIKARSRRWYAENTGRARAKNRQWRRNNPDKFREYIRMNAQKRRAQKANADQCVTVADIREITKRQGGKCAHCQKPTKLTIDHIVALARGGQHHKTNIQMLCGICNSRKGAKDPIEFAQSRGMLL